MKSEFKKGDKVLVKKTVKAVIVDVHYDKTHKKYYYRCEPLENVPRDVQLQCGVVDFKDIYRPAYMLEKL